MSQKKLEESPSKEIGSGLKNEEPEEPEYVSKEMQNENPIENDHQTVLVVANYLDQNQEFAAKYDYLVDWQNTDNESNNNFIAKFRLKPQFREGQSQSKEQSDQNPQKANGPTPGGRGAALRSTSGQWRSQHAQQRERDISGNNRLYRESFTREPYGKENYHPYRPTSPYQKPGTSLRSNSPKRNVQPSYVPIMKQTQGFGLYEQHREQREQREHLEFQKIQNEHGKHYELVQMSNGIRDRIIATYRAEIESHKFLERDFCNLKAHIEDLKRRKDQVDMSVTTLQGDYEAQIQSQENVVASLNNELNILKNQNDDKHREGVEVSEQTQAVRIEISAQDRSIAEHQCEITTVVSHNQGLEREDENLRHAIAEQQELRQRQQGNIYQSNGALSKWEQECYAQSSRINVLDKERKTLVDRTNSLNNQLNVRTQQIEETASKIHAAQTDISKLKSMIHGLDIEINTYERSNAALVEDQKVKLQRNSDEYNRAHELTSTLQSMEAKFYSLEVEERGQNTDLEAVNYSNQALMDRNLDLKSEYEALQKHSTLLTQQNKDLQRELDTFVETDDIVRKNLDRKEKIDHLRYSVNSAIQESVNKVYNQRSKSPAKSSYDPQGAGKFTSQFSVQQQQNNYRPKSYNQEFSPARQQSYGGGRRSPLRKK